MPIRLVLLPALFSMSSLFAQHEAGDVASAAGKGNGVARELSEVERLRDALARFSFMPAQEHLMAGADQRDHSGFLEIHIDIPELNTVRATVVLFEPGSSTVPPQYLVWFDHLANVMLQYPQTLLRFEAHTDSTGSARVNQRLSELRASEVERLLVERGVPRERMQPVGFGQRRPIAENTDDAGRRSNRRVEFRAFLPVKGKP